MSVKTTTASRESVMQVVLALRESDINESQAYGISDPMIGIMASVKRSHYSRVVTIDDAPVCVYGLSIPDPISGVGRPWLMGTNLIDRYKKRFIMDTRVGVNEMLDITPILINWVHSDNMKSIRWLRHLGFTVSNPGLLGVTGAMFCEFKLTKG